MSNANKNKKQKYSCHCNCVEYSNQNIKPIYDVETFESAHNTEVTYSQNDNNNRINKRHSNNKLICFNHVHFEIINNSVPRIPIVSQRLRRRRSKFVLKF